MNGIFDAAVEESEARGNGRPVSGARTTARRG
jgi:hypothetical protein